ncbi:MAG: hypothetical protein ACTSV7_08950 [Candidatus Baldrarchaeia archaeon]
MFYWLIMGRARRILKRKTEDAGNIRDVRVEAKLKHELQRLQKKFGLGLELKDVKWMPNYVKHNVEGKQLSGEVLGNTVYIYEKDIGEALKTLKHEFFDYVFSHQIEKPYKEFINKLISLFEVEMYRRKEKLIGKLSELV